MLRDFLRARAVASGAGLRLLSRLRNRFLYLTPRYLRYLGHTVVLTPWVMGFVALYLFAFVPQMQEIGIGIIEEHDAVRGLLGLASLSAFSALLYVWTHRMVTRRIDAIYPDHADIYFDRGVTGIRDFKAMVVSSLPFAGLGIGLFAMRSQVQSAASHIKTVADALGGGLDQAGTLEATLAALPGNISLCLALTMAVAIGVILGLHWSRDRLRWHGRFLDFCYALTALLAIAPMLASSTTLLASRLVGPLAVTGLVLIAGAVTFRVLLFFAAQIVWVLAVLPSVLLLPVRRMPFGPAKGIAVLIPMLAAVWIGVEIAETSDEAAAFRPASILEELRERSKNTDKHRSALAQTLASWLKARQTGAGEYPVFIVTAEGGGIYAASAAAFFLAGMQERCPDFAEHIFAISAVSGGSIGSSLFDAALAEGTKAKDVSRAGGAPAGCLEPTKPGELFERLRKITGDDHLSPVLAYILPDLARNIRELFAGAPAPKEPCSNEARFEWFGRDQILEKSFIASFDRSKSSKRSLTTVCPSAADTNMLMRNFSEAWSPQAKLPALLLNATWVETGYRVAFSPFPLQHLGEGTLYSFDDVAALAGQAHEAPQSWQNPSLIGAAAVSARFPFIMPPWATNTRGKNRWTFVDGGYADASGAATGLELYRDLKKQLEESPELRGLADANGKEIRSGQIKLYLISLTDAYVEPDYRSITGSSLDDFISPVNTILTVRELLARRAVTQAYGELGDDLISIQLDQQTFPLPLGWKISALSSDIVRFGMGRPDRCDRSRDKDPNFAVWTANHNSCELKRITALLTPAKTPAPELPLTAKAPAPEPPAPPNITAPAAIAPAKALGTWLPQPQ